MVTAALNVDRFHAGSRALAHLLDHGVTIDDLAITADTCWLPDGAYPALRRQLADLDAFLAKADDDRAIGAWLMAHDGPVNQRERLAAVSIAHQLRKPTAVGIKVRLEPLSAPAKRILLPIELAAVRAASLAAPDKAALVGAVESGLAQVEIVGLLSADVIDDGARLRTRGGNRTRPREVPVPIWARPSLRACTDQGFGLLYNGNRPALKDQTASIGMRLLAVLAAAGVGYDPTVSGQSIANTIMVQVLRTDGAQAVAQRLGRISLDGVVRRLSNATWS